MIFTELKVNKCWVALVVRWNQRRSQNFDLGGAVGLIWLKSSVYIKVLKIKCQNSILSSAKQFRLGGGWVQIPHCTPSGYATGWNCQHQFGSIQVFNFCRNPCNQRYKKVTPSYDFKLLFRTQCSSNLGLTPNKSSHYLIDKADIKTIRKNGQNNLNRWCNDIDGFFLP